jgi:PAS domain S-box-containing protein
METTKEEVYKDILEKRQRIREFAEDFIFIVDNNFFIKYLNTHAAKHFGRPQLEVVGKPLSGLFSSHSYENLRQKLEIVFNSGEFFSLENNILFPNKELWLNSQFTPIKERDVVTGILVIARDITERKR